MVIEWEETPGEPVWPRAQQLAGDLARERPAFVAEAVPAYTTVTVSFDPGAVRAAGAAAGQEGAWMAAWLRGRAERGAAEAVREERPSPRRVEVPVYYGNGYGPDLAAVAAQARLAPEEVVRRHAAAEYRAALVGFAPGFAYLAGLPPELAVPRRATPRAEVPAGAVGIAGGQTGIYPLVTPGGWNLIGRTPLRLFRPEEDPPVLIAPGDVVRFRPIGQREFVEIAERPLIVSLGAAAAAGGREGGGEVASHAWVRRAGALTTVQDLGRPGWQRFGVPVGGALDREAAGRANRMVGNDVGAAVLECTLEGPELEFGAGVLAALTGGEFVGTLNGEPLPAGRVWVIPAGARLALGAARRGLRGWLAISGGWAVPRVLGSRSTYLRARLGGWQGRPLEAGDSLPVGMPSAWAVRQLESARREHRTVAGWGGDFWTAGLGEAEVTVRLRRGPEWAEFAPAAQQMLGAAGYRVTPQSDRMGLRLAGPPLLRVVPRELASAAVTEGVVQVPPDGQPIVLLADRQTVGGYPRIGVVEEADLGRLAQVRPGQTVRFVVGPE